jgi:hypothetical protein
VLLLAFIRKDQTMECLADRFKNFATTLKAACAAVAEKLQVPEIISDQEKNYLDQKKKIRDDLNKITKRKVPMKHKNPKKGKKSKKPMLQVVEDPTRFGCCCNVSPSNGGGPDHCPVRRYQAGAPP